MHVVGSVLQFVILVGLANISVWVGSWALANLTSGFDAMLLLGTPALLFVVPGLVLRRVAKAREGAEHPAEEPKKKRPPSPLRDFATGMMVYGVLCALALAFVCPAACGWVLLLTGDAVEFTSVEAAASQHRGAMYISFEDARVLEGAVGSETVAMGWRTRRRRFYAAPVVPRRDAGSRAVLTRPAVLAGHQPFRVWLGAEKKEQIAALVRAEGVFGGLVLRGGDYRKAVDNAVAAHGLKPVDDPLILDLAAPTYAGALSAKGPWAYLALGLFNLAFMALAYMGARGSARKRQPNT